MNQKKDIIDAWIAVEQFSEGDIKSNDRKYKKIDFEKVSRLNTDKDSVSETKRDILDWKSYFLQEMDAFLEREKISEKNRDEAGIILYFGIFKFEEVIKIIREKYKIKDTEEELKSGEKFTLSLSFDKDLNLVQDKLFLTMAGFVRENQEIPINLIEEEDKWKSKLAESFEENGFNQSFDKLAQDFLINDENFRISFVKKMENTNIDMHSFFIDDLKTAKKLDTDNLNRYLSGFDGKRVNLDGNCNSCQFNPSVFYDILEPKNYPMGRFPSNPDFALSFMQQVAVNLYLNDSNNIMSVNGPPGTGKTTLLKDIFADLMVRQAHRMLKLIETPLTGKYRISEKSKIAEIPKEIAKNSILVASSNNGAVQNIVVDLPKKKDIDESFLEQLYEVDYFVEVANSEIKKTYNKESKKYELEIIAQELENWGMFSIEGGASVNVNRLLDKVEMMFENLQQWDVSKQEEEQIIRDFKELYDKVESYKEGRQKIYLDFKNLDTLKEEMERGKKQLKLEPQKREEIDSKKSKIEEEIRIFEEKKIGFETELSNITEKISQNLEDLERAKRNFDVASLQKPKETPLSKLKALFGKSQDDQYAQELKLANDALNRFEDEKIRLQAQKIQANERIKEYKNAIIECQNQKEKLEKELESWASEQRQIIAQTECKLHRFEEKLQEQHVKLLHFNASYDELQKSNPWFDKEFRILQSELFMASLKVRKLFLWKHRMFLKTAKNVFSLRNDYLSKENGKKMIQMAWEWINIAIPIVSSTFASFGRMFRHFEENALGSLFIDEAGQALPQACVGSLFRSAKVMAVGDPSQIKPVLTLDSNMMNLIAQKYHVDESFISNSASTQSLIDATAQYGFEKEGEEWIGIPLWVHRRSNYPMFNISNQISYQNLMVQGKKEEDAYGKAFWYDVKGNALDKYVEAQGQKLKELIEQRLSQSPELKDHIYVITPFKNVANKLIEKLQAIDFVARDEKHRVTNIGTVHTFQGKEAKIVYFVLGADKNSEGAAAWAVSEPNIINVAATRAKEEFYVIGDKSLYSNLGSTVASDTINIIEEYNVNRAEGDSYDA